MLGVCARYTDSLEEAEDILQEGFIKIFQKMESFRNQGSLEGWIKRIMINTALDSFRKNKNLRYQIDIETIENEKSSKRRYDNNVQHGKNNNNVDESKKNDALNFLYPSTFR